MSCRFKVTVKFWRTALTSHVPIQGLQFVAETGVARPKGSLRELIRSQARRKRPNRGQKAASKRSSSILRASNKWDQQNEASISTDPYSSGPLTWRDATPRPDRGLASNAFDPFYTLPIDENGNSHFLLSQCQSRVFIYECYRRLSTLFKFSYHITRA